MNRTNRWRHWLGAGVLAVLLGAGSWFARAADTGDFAQGNARYEAGDYSGAAKAYEAQVRSGRLSANVFYNLGDAYFRAGDKGRAVLNYRRALVLEPVQSEASSNLAFVTGGKNEGGPGGETDFYRAAGTWGTAACGWLGAAGLLLAVVNRRRRAMGMVVAATGFLLCTAGAAVLWYFSVGSGGTRAVVVAEGTSALYSPVEGAKRVTMLTTGGQVSVLSEQGAWTYVLLGDGTTRAWVESKAIERFVP